LDSTGLLAGFEESALERFSCPLKQVVGGVGIGEFSLDSTGLLAGYDDLALNYFAWSLPSQRSTIVCG
jgi:hypothetical protein